MPELPEVQTIVDDLIQAGLIGRTVTGCRVSWPRTVAEAPVKAFCRRIAGRRVAALGRRGKFIRCDLSGGLCLLIHLRMTGRLVLARAEAPLGRHEHVRLRLDDGRELRFHDPRKFGRMWLTDNPDVLLHRLGPEPLSSAFSAQVLAARLAGRQRAIKPLLLDQTVLAGLGNIYVDEALWQARLHPLQPAGSLSMDQVRELHRSVRRVLRQGLANGGTSLGSGQSNFSATTRGAGENRRALKVFRRTGQDCPRCGGVIQRLVVGQRSTHICPQCQQAGG
ncbi:MAG: bifunctional DNA-formamidopyrimidine glycosylase/DNA-(apurinic or apyrimidinic site) lyase, partial [Desulfobacteraceae bacterium]|jgi:formamidopyrimidine-DNA glycosylase|nr:bifunctional DNA-formamidopyrimidine glycosylase/DNA-(apurinic or apyrimidinic site) lyase [Desulfobacteraceae bacterium]